MNFIEVSTKLKEIFELQEHAFSKDQVENKCISLSPELWEHVIKILFFINGNEQEENGWAKEIKKWLNQGASMRMKSNNKFPNEKQLRTWFTLGYNKKEDLTRILDDLQEEYYPLNISLDKIHKITLQTIFDLCHQVAISPLTIQQVINICQRQRNYQI